MKLGFIGCGNMATAIAKGVIQSKLFSNDMIIATDIIDTARTQFELNTTIQTTENIDEVLQSEFIIIAIKPQHFSEFLTVNGNKISKSSALISIAAGKKISWIESYCTEKQPLVRIMPNLNATIGMSVTAVAKNDYITAEQFQIITKIITSFGSIHHIDETHFSAFTSIAGSSPAYFFKMIEAMSTSAQKQGIDYEIAKQIIIDTMIGSATFAKQNVDSLGTLIQNVTSPNGTTEAALKVLNHASFDDIIDKAQLACMKRDIELSFE